MADSKEDHLEEEMAKRLEDLFSESGEDADVNGSPSALPESDESGAADASHEIEKTAGDTPVMEGEKPMAVQGGSMSDERALRELKATILSMDWEITDEVMARLIEQIGQVKSEYGQDRNIFLLLKVLGSVGNYIKVNKGHAHPNAINLIKSAYSGVERLCLEPDLEETERKRILITEVNNFKTLKSKIGKETSAVAAPSAYPSSAGGDAVGGEVLNDRQMDAFRAVVVDVVRQELATLKRDLLAEIKRG